MTEWVFFAKIIYNWKGSLNEIQKNYHYYPYKFIMAADIWVFINMGQAILLSIPAINLYTHGTHITVAHAMGTTIGINSMILIAACFEFLKPNLFKNKTNSKYLNFIFWLLQLSLFIFWISLNIAGIKKGIWQMSENQISYSKMMETLTPYFIIFVIAGFGLLISFFAIAIKLLKNSTNSLIINKF
jgi:nitric oxide reductase subunit B